MKSLIVLVALFAAGCGSSPTAPTPPVSFTGVYTGAYVVSSCNDGGLTGFCTPTAFVVGARFPVSLSLGQTQNAVAGTVILGGISGTFQGTASGASLNGTAALNPVVALGTTATPNVTAWNSVLATNAMTGGFTLQFKVAGFAGTAIVTADLSGVSR